MRARAVRKWAVFQDGKLVSEPEEDVLAVIAVRDSLSSATATIEKCFVMEDVLEPDNTLTTYIEHNGVEQAYNSRVPFYEKWDVDK